MKGLNRKMLIKFLIWEFVYMESYGQWRFNVFGELQ